MENKTYDQLITELKEETLKLSSSEISMEQAMKIFEENIKRIQLAKEKLTEYKGTINKVLEENKIEEFN
ncbi:exodeoxyribonuclease VII small subunit [Mesoplasma entomophilum]|uniref:Exodeoxyribonuclease VII small subunit n=2 Tax=Mesoplasma TaxID=46239 RepID=A0A2K8P2Y3_9MOLU|nr:MULTISPECIES: exodeoxyribonuclease VII small subunit [Mesoplasma]ATQ35492.1 exodeoxyribonuclease VII small subunit [Mesoplasma entomophilum]ATZ19452.1 exodeoxyribonuclease VII small subunit [Mesoplasma entomophilum]ATZ20858.1 exodeoxyribonuclease VII small subunit [Mesoplasma coleopterae]AVN60341.1 exodeoxyribonuclease VII small subunit [Mesoplasma entomophilum]AVN62358.1 exodeoxyribonuclease VII small subunit [Mesoplasma coleopterae]